MFDILAKPLGWILAQIYSVVPDLGVAIILLTLLIMLAMYPLTAKQAKSMIAMQRVQPEVKRLQAKYKNDRQKLNEEMMRFYQENKINPLAGCLPLLVQMPILFALFRTLRAVQDFVPRTSSLYAAFCEGLQKCGLDTTKGQKIHHLGFVSNSFLDLQKHATQVTGLSTALPYYLLVVGVVVVGYLQTRQAQKRTPAVNKQMAAVTKVLPLLFAFISLSLPSGVVLYYFVSSFWRLGQQEIIFRRYYHHDAAGGARTKPAIDVESKDVGPTAGNGSSPPEAKVAGNGAKAAPTPRNQPPRRISETGPKPAAKPSPVPVPAAGGDEYAGGLRGLFQLPPLPTGPPPRPAAPAPRVSSPRTTPRKPVERRGGISDKKNRRG